MNTNEKAAHMDSLRKTVNEVAKGITSEVNREAILFRIERSMVQSLLDVPAIGIEQMRFKYQEDDSLEGSFATDGETIFYNPFTVNKMTEQQLNTALVHQTLHFILRHLQRREDRHVERWDAACDEEVKVVINDEIKSSYRRYHTNYHFDRDMIRTLYASGTTAEQIYNQQTSKVHKDDDIHGLWELVKMESARLKDTTAVDFDFSKVFAGEEIEVPEDAYDQFRMIEALANYTLSIHAEEEKLPNQFSIMQTPKSPLTKVEVENFLKFSMQFPTAMCVYLAKRTVINPSFRTALLNNLAWIEWAKVYKHYIL